MKAQHLTDNGELVKGEGNWVVIGTTKKGAHVVLKWTRTRQEARDSRSEFSGQGFAAVGLQKVNGGVNENAPAKLPQKGANATARRPKPGTICARIWDKADALADAADCPIQKRRARLLAWAEKKGINRHTANTQFQRWSQAGAA